MRPHDAGLGEPTCKLNVHLRWCALRLIWQTQPRSTIKPAD
jgi:hypothetical protein